MVLFINLLIKILREREPLTRIEEENVNLAFLACYNNNLKVLHIFRYRILVLLM